MTQSRWPHSFVVLATALLLLLAGAAQAQVSTPSPSDRATGVAASAALSWRSDAKANRYDVYLGTANPPSSAVARNASSTTYQPAAPLQASTTYYWRVDSKGPKNYSATGPVWSFTTAAAPPPLPSAPAGASPAPGATGVPVSTALSWSASSNATAYDVAFGTSASPPVVSSGQAGTSFTPPTRLAYAQTYYWRITAVGAGGTTAGPLWSFTTANAPPSTSRDRLRLLTWNVQSGRNAGGTLAVDAQVALMADSGADLIALQEVTITQTGGDLPALYKSKLEALTGRTWYQLWAPEPRAATDAPEGNVVLSRIPLLASATTQFDAAPSDPAALDAKQSAAAATVVVNGVAVTVITTRMPQDASYRQTQAAAFTQWAAAFAAPRVLGGDFEMQPGDATYASITGAYADVWTARAGTQEYGFTIEPAAGTSTPASRADYWLQEAGSGSASASEVWVVKTTRSDHHAVVVDVEVR